MRRHTLILEIDVLAEDEYEAIGQREAIVSYLEEHPLTPTWSIIQVREVPISDYDNESILGAYTGYDELRDDGHTYPIYERDEL